MKGASRWLDACAGPTHDAASAEAKSAAGIAFATGRCRKSLDMESLLEHSLEAASVRAPPAAARRAAPFRGCRDAGRRPIYGSARGLDAAGDGAQPGERQRDRKRVV